MDRDKLWFTRALLSDGWHDDVLVSVDAGGAIAAIDRNAPAGTATRFDGIALPGIPNVHSHAHQRALAGLTERSGAGPDSFWTWRTLMYRFLGTMSPDDFEAIAAQLYVELLKAGYTCVGEFQYLHHDPKGHAYETRAEMSLRALNAARATGIGITLLPTLYAYSGFGGAAPGQDQRRFINDAAGFVAIIDELKTAIAGDPNATLGIAPHSLRSVTSDLLAAVMAHTNHVLGDHPVHMHVAEQTNEVDLCLAWSGARPADWLMDTIGIDQRWCLIHATHLSDGEVDRLAASGAVVGLCPTTEANLGDGIFRGLRYLEGGGRIAIGSDSHIGRSPAEELRLLEYSQRLIHHGRNMLAGGIERSTGRRLLDASLAGGAQIMGCAIGSLAVGRRADILVLDGQDPSLAGRHGDWAIDSWIFSAGDAAISDVFVGGRHVIADRHHTQEDAIAARYRTVLKRLLAE